MTHAPFDQLHAPAAAAAQPMRPARLTASTATAIGSAALSMGVLADTLFHDEVGGLAFALWIALLTVTLVALVWHDGRSVPREAAAWLVAAAGFASCLAWRNSEVLQFLDVVATLGCLGLAIIRVRDPLAGILAQRARETIAAGVRAGLEIAFGALPLVLRELATTETREGRSMMFARSRAIARSAALAAVVLLIFGSLLRSADPIFASMVALPSFDVGNLVSHIVVILFFTAIVAGWSRSALLPDTTRVSVPSGYGFSLGAVDIMTILGTLNVLFATFVVAQLGWFFGGEQFLRERTGLTVAQYARGGFFQVLWVVALVVPVLVVTRGALQPGRALARRHTMLALPVITLLGVMIAGAAARLNLYVKFYGMTTDRFYPLVFMGWLFATLVWLTVTVLRDWGRPFALGAALSAMLTLVTLNVIDPDAIVARVNLARASRAPVAGSVAGAVAGAVALDVGHLASLSGRAIPYAVEALIADQSQSTTSPLRTEGRCTAAMSLIKRFGPASATRRLRADMAAPWRFWNADDALAADAVAKHFSAILETRHIACAAARQNAPGVAQISP